MLRILEEIPFEFSYDNIERDNCGYTYLLVVLVSLASSVKEVVACLVGDLKDIN